jgi:hypothetical protein
MAAPEVIQTPSQPANPGDKPVESVGPNTALPAFQKQIELLYRERALNGLPPTPLNSSNKLDFGGPNDFDKLYHPNDALQFGRKIGAHIAMPHCIRSETNPATTPNRPCKPGEAQSKSLKVPSPELTTTTDHIAKQTDAAAKTSAPETVEQSRAKLEQSARERFKNDPQGLANFDKDMQDFEQRMAKNPNGAIEVQRTYDNINKLLVGPSSMVSESDRLKIAKEVMHEVAHVGPINQGATNCCGAAALEARLYDRSPSQASRLVEEVTLTGRYHEFPDGHVITVDRNSIAHHITDVEGGAKLGVEPRSHASQIFQTTAMNIYVDSINQKQDPPGKVRYEIGNASQFSSGEKLVDYSTHPPKQVWPGDPKFQDYKTVLDGLPAMTNDVDNIYERMAGVSDGGFNVNLLTADNREAFKEKLAELKREGKFPLTMVVDFEQEPFKTQNGGVSVDELHFISIRDYNPQTGEIDYTNSWFGSKVFKSNATDLFRAMHAPDDPILIDTVAKGLKDVHDPAKINYILDNELLLIEQEQRAEVIDKLSKQLGVNLWDSLTDEQLKDLGISRPNIFDRGWDAVTGMFK